jgi:arylsulfatase A-like enzyme
MSKLGSAPNILWVCTDAQRWDTIAAFGNRHIRTPAFDEVCSLGAGFRRTYTQNPMCTPARASMLTGRYPAAHQVYRNGNANFPGSEVLLPKLLSTAGYTCGLVGKLHVATARFGEDRQADGYSFFRWSKHAVPDEAVEYSDHYKWLKQKGIDMEELYRDRWTLTGPGIDSSLHLMAWGVEQCLEFIDRNRDRRWMLSFNPMVPHPPFDPPPEYWNKYADADLPGPAFRESDLVRQQRFAGVRHQCPTAFDPRGEMDYSNNPYKQQIDRCIKLPAGINGRALKVGYYGMIEYINDQLMRLFDGLKAMGLWEDTLTLVHSDHGEMLGDHGLIFKGARFFEGATRVPMAMAWPGHTAPGVMSEALVELVDIAPTLLEAAGFAVPPYMQGRSLWPIATGRADPAFHKAHAVCDFNDSVGYTPNNTHTRATMVVGERYKSIFYHDMDLAEVFDLDEDPDEFDDLSERPEFSRTMMALTREHMDAVIATIPEGPVKASMW